VEGDRVDLEVVTQDVWTLSLSFDFGRSGGRNKYTIELQDHNLLGTGQDVALGRRQSFDRTSNLLRYSNDTFLGTRNRVGLWLASNSDGFQRSVRFARPFFSLDTRRAGGAFASSEERTDDLYTQGEVFDSFRHEIGFFEGNVGFSSGFRGGRTVRWQVGYTWDDNTFGPDPESDEPSPPPPDRTLSYPWVGVNLLQDRFITVRNLDQIERTEDLNLGTQLDARIGLASRALGGDRDQVVARFLLQRGWSLKGERRLAFVSASASGRWGAEGSENVRVGTRLRFYQRTFGRHLFSATLELDVAHNLDPETQLLLGGDTGLRGYPLRYQDGDRRFLFTLEQRFYTRLYPLRLVRVGAAVFADVGRCWFEHDPRPGNRGVLRDVGFGLRFVSHKASSPTVHVDIAFPLDRDPSISSVQWLISTKDTF